MDRETHFPANINGESPPPEAETSKDHEDKRKQRWTIIGLALAGLILIGLLVVAVIYLVNPATPTTRIRDIFIILMALEFLVVGVALIILIVQLASLINLLQNEVKPILDSTKETSHTLRGTALFLSDNLVEPVIKLSGYVASMQRMVSLFGFIRKPKGKI
ncbi:MAG: hypothetical protein IBX69_01020 [Anaerolineales bacterium]|nr:hypothetical protein [Anaerolineales bacterium]